MTTFAIIYPPVEQQNGWARPRDVREVESFGHGGARARLNDGTLICRTQGNEWINQRTFEQIITTTDVEFANSVIEAMRARNTVGMELMYVTDRVQFVVNNPNEF